jgi:hypothetical protein
MIFYFDRCSSKNGYFSIHFDETLDAVKSLVGRYLTSEQPFALSFLVLDISLIHSFSSSMGYSQYWFLYSINVFWMDYFRVNCIYQFLIFYQWSKASFASNFHVLLHRYCWAISSIFVWLFPIVFSMCLHAF